MSGFITELWSAGRQIPLHRRRTYVVTPLWWTCFCSVSAPINQPGSNTLCCDASFIMVQVIAGHKEMVQCTGVALGWVILPPALARIPDNISAFVSVGGFQEEYLLNHTTADYSIHSSPDSKCNIPDWRKMAADSLQHSPWECINLTFICCVGRLFCTGLLTWQGADGQLPNFLSVLEYPLTFQDLADSKQIKCDLLFQRSIETLMPVHISVSKHTCNGNAGSEMSAKQAFICISVKQEPYSRGPARSGPARPGPARPETLLRGLGDLPSIADYEKHYTITLRFCWYEHIPKMNRCVLIRHLALVLLISTQNQAIWYKLCE